MSRRRSSRALSRLEHLEMEKASFQKALGEGPMFRGAHPGVILSQAHPPSQKDLPVTGLEAGTQQPACNSAPARESWWLVTGAHEPRRPLTNAGPGLTLCLRRLLFSRPLQEGS